MTSCEMCGKNDTLFLVEVEGVKLSLCKRCSRYGRVIKEIRPSVFSESIKKKAIAPKKEVILVVREDVGALVKMSREKLGLKQNEFAKLIAEKESKIHKLETGHYVPSIDVARKLEKILKISLVEQKEVVEEESSKEKAKAQPNLTIGDLIKVK